MPRYGCINERKNQLHEVIRLSGMNIVINDVDRPLVIKVASISAARMQIYFIDNEDYFHRKSIYRDEKGEFFSDNGERAIFFARGVLEAVKKQRWSPDVIHCQGWISHLLPLYLKKAYKDDPIFSNSKIVLSLYDDTPQETFPADIKDKILFNGITEKDLEIFSEPSGINLAKLAASYSDGIIMGIAAIVEAHPLALKDPAPFVRLSAHDASALVYTVRVWCKSADYWTVYFDLMEDVKKALDENGIEIPFQQVDVRMRND